MNEREAKKQYFVLVIITNQIHDIVACVFLLNFTNDYNIYNTFLTIVVKIVCFFKIKNYII